MGKKFTLYDYETKYENSPYDISVIGMDGDNLTLRCNNCHRVYPRKKRAVLYRITECPFCGDGVSFPNKYLRNFLIQLPIQNLVFEYYSEWTQRKKYDASFEYNDKKYVVEIDGIQHSTPHFKYTLDYQIKNDALKNQLAEDAGYVMIRIDAKESSSEYIKRQIEKSILNELFDLSIVDWKKCEDKANSSLVIQVCNFFNENQTHYEAIMDHFHICQALVYKYLKKGQQLGLVGDYKAVFKRERYKKASKTCSLSKGSPVKVYDLTTYNCVGIFDSYVEASNIIREKYGIDRFDTTKISHILSNNNTRKTYLNFTFCHTDESLTKEDIQKIKPITKYPIAVYDGDEIIALYADEDIACESLSQKYGIEFLKKKLQSAMSDNYKYNGLKFKRYID